MPTSLEASVEPPKSPVKAPVEAPVESPIEPSVEPLGVPAPEPVEVVLRKDPKRVEQGKRLAQISRAAKEAKKKRLHAEEMERAEEEFKKKYANSDWWFGSWTGSLLLGAGSVGLAWLLMSRKPTFVLVPKNSEMMENKMSDPPLASKQSAPKRKFANLD